MQKTGPIFTNYVEMLHKINEMAKTFLRLPEISCLSSLSI